VVDLVGVTQRFDLMRLPDLVATERPKDLGARGALVMEEALEAGLPLTRALADAYAAEDIVFHATIVNFFATGRLRWCVSGDGTFEVALGPGRAMRVARRGEEWVVLALKDGMVIPVWRGPSMEYARGAAEQYVASLGTSVEVPGYSFRGRWCDEPATEKQLAVLRRAGIVTAAGITRGAASEQIARLARTWEVA
jgi:hypothetical protein